MSYVEEAAAEIKGRIKGLEMEAETLRRALLVLQGTPTTAPPAPRRRANGGRRSSGRNGSASGSDLSREKVLDAVRAGNSEASKIATEFGTTADVVRERLKALEAAGEIKREGERALTRWHAVAK